MQVLGIDGTNGRDSAKHQGLTHFSATFCRPCRHHHPHLPPQALRIRLVVVKHIPPAQGLRLRAGPPWMVHQPPWMISFWSLVLFAAKGDAQL